MRHILKIWMEISIQTFEVQSNGQVHSIVERTSGGFVAKYID